MDQDRPEYAEAIHAGKRRSSLGALSKSKPVTKLKSMFETKGLGPKVKEPGIFDKLRPVYASHDASSFGAILGSMGAPTSLQMSVNGPLQQPPATPTAPLFSVLPGPGEPDALPNPSPPRSVEDLQVNAPIYQESLPDGGDVEVRSAKSPGSAGFLKRMSSSLKKALTPKSSTGKQKSDGFSPSYAGSDASNLSPRPSGQLVMTPGSQPSSTSMDLNCRSDQTQSAQTRSPSVLMGYEFHSARDYPEWARAGEANLDIPPRPTSSNSRPPRSPSITPAPVGSVPDSAALQHEASPLSTSRDVSPRPQPMASPDQGQMFKDMLADGTPMAAEDSFASADDKGTSVPIATGAEDSFAASLTASPTAPDCSEGPHGDPPMREVNMGAAIFSPPPYPSESDLLSDIASDHDGGELVFPSLPSADPQESAMLALEGSALMGPSPVAGGFDTLIDGLADVDMAACDSALPIEDLPDAAPHSDNLANTIPSTSAPTSSMEVDAMALQEPPLHHPLPLASRRGFSTSSSLNLDLSRAVTNSPDSPDAATPTGEENGIGDDCIIGLTPVRPDTAVMCGMLVDAPTLSTVAEGSPEASPAPTSETPVMDLEDNFRRAHAIREMDIEPVPSGANAAVQEPAPCHLALPSDGNDIYTITEGNILSESAPQFPSPVHDVPPMVVSSVVVPVAADMDMDWDDNADAISSAVAVNKDTIDAVTSDSAATTHGAEVAPECIAPDESFTRVTPTPIAALQVDAEPQSVCCAEPVVSARECPVHDDGTVAVQQPDAGTDALTEPAGDKHALVDELRISSVSIVGLMERGNLPTQPKPNDTPSELAGLPTPDMGPGTAVDTRNDDILCNAQEEMPADSFCLADIESVNSIVPGLEPSEALEFSPQEVGVISSTPDMVSCVDGEQVVAVTVTDVLPPKVDSLLTGSEVAAPSSVPKASYQQPFGAAQGNDSSSVPYLAQVKEDIDMEDAEVVSAHVLDTAGQTSAAFGIGVDTAQPAIPSPVEVEPAVDKPTSSSSSEEDQLHDGMHGATAGDVSCPDIIHQDGTAHESQVQTVVVDAAELRKVEEEDASYAVAEEAVPGLSSCIQLALPELDALEEPQQQAADVHLPAQALMPESNAAEAGMDVAGAVHVNSVPGPMNTPAAANAEAEDAEPRGQPITEPESGTNPHLTSAETAPAMNPFSDVPAEVTGQPVEGDTDLMDVDSSETGLEMPNAAEMPIDICVDAAPDAEAAAVRGVSLKPPVSQPVHMAQEGVSEAAELYRSPMPPQLGCEAEVQAEPDPLQEVSMPLAVNQGLATYGAKASGLDNVDTAAENAGMQTASSPPVKFVPTGQVFASQTDLTAYDLEPPNGQQDDPMMVSPMPQRFSTFPPGQPWASAQAVPLASLHIDASGAEAPPAQCDGRPFPTSIGPDTARLGLRAFQIDDIEESEAIMEIQVGADEVATQEQLPSVGDDAAADTPDALEPPAQTISPEIGGMIVTAVTAATTAENFEDGGAAPTTAAACLANGASAPDVLVSVPSVSAPPTLSAGVDVSMADSLEEIEALWGNDDLLAEPSSATAAPLAPQVASSPVSASKSAALSQSGRKVAPGVVLQVERESLDLFSLRNSCAARVSDSLMVESLDSFESMGLCMKSRAVGFIPMAPLREGDEDAAMAGRPSGSEGGSGSGSAGPQSPSVTFPVHNSGSPDSQATPGLNGTASATAAATGIPSSNKSGARACSPGQAAHASKSNMPVSATKTATPGGNTRANATPSTALKAMATGNAGGSSASKVGVSKRPLPVAAPPSRQLSTPGHPIAGPSGPSPGSRLPGFVATPSMGITRAPATAHGAKPPVPTATPVTGSGRPGVTPRSGAVFSSGKGQPQASGVSRPGLCAQQPGAGARAGAGNGLFDTPLILRAAAVPLVDTPFSGCDFDLDTVDISAEASKAIAMLGGGDSSKADLGTANVTAQHATPVLAPARGAAIASTPTLSVLETHVQLLTSKLAEGEASIHHLQDENAMLRDQLSMLQFESSMTNDLDMEREARQFLEQELSVVRHRSDGLEADLRAAHAEVKRREQAAAELLAAQQTREAEWARKEAEMELRMQQMASEVEAARSFAQRADARIAEAESRASAASVKCDEETARGRELQVTLGLQAHQLVQVQRARDDAEAKFQRAMEQLIAAQTTHKKAVVEYEQKLLQSNNLVSQINDVRDKYRQMKQHAANAEQRAQHAEAKAQETAAALAKANMEKAELMQMCNELLTQLEATKVKGGR